MPPISNAPHVRPGTIRSQTPPGTETGGLERRGVGDRQRAGQYDLGHLSCPGTPCRAAWPGDRPDRGRTADCRPAASWSPGADGSARRPQTLLPGDLPTERPLAVGAAVGMCARPAALARLVADGTDSLVVPLSLVPVPGYGRSVVVAGRRGAATDPRTILRLAGTVAGGRGRRSPRLPPVCSSGEFIRRTHPCRSGFPTGWPPLLGQDS